MTEDGRNCVRCVMKVKKVLLVYHRGCDGQYFKYNKGKSLKRLSCFFSEQNKKWLDFTGQLGYNKITENRLRGWAALRAAALEFML